VGLEDRDWYREEPSRAWNELRGGAGAGPGASPAVGSSGGLGASIARVSLAAIAATGLLLAFFVLFGPPISFDHGPRDTLPLNVSDREIVLQPTPETVRHATGPTPWTLTDPRFGTIVVTVPTGEAPLNVIAAELSARGFSPVMLDHRIPARRA
jgi:hypothetical protein